MHSVGVIKEVFDTYLLFKTMLSAPGNTCHHGYCVTVHSMERVVAFLFYSVRRQIACAQLWGVCQFWVSCSNNSKIQLNESTVMYIFLLDNRWRSHSESTRCFSYSPKCSFQECFSAKNQLVFQRIILYICSVCSIIYVKVTKTSVVDLNTNGINGKWIRVDRQVSWYFVIWGLLLKYKF